MVITTFPTLDWGVVSAEATITLEPGPDAGSDLTVTPVLTGGLYTVIPQTVAFSAGATSRMFRVLSSAAGVNGALTYAVSSTAGSAADYGVQASAGATRLVADNALGTSLNVTLVTRCPTGNYPGPRTTITTSSGDSAVTCSCIACPASTTTYVDVPTDKSDCKCAAGLVDVRAYLPPGVNLDTSVTPCIAPSVYCKDGGEGCVTFRQGAFVSINPGYWKYEPSLTLRYLGDPREGFGPDKFLWA